MATSSKAHRRTLAEKVDPRNTALAVIDMQNDFCHPDGYFGKRGGDLSAVGPAAAKIEALVAEARRLDILILWVRAHYDDINTGAAMADAFKRSGDDGEGRLMAGSWGADWLEGLRPNDAPNEAIVSKHRYSAFAGRLEEIFNRRYRGRKGRKVASHPGHHAVRVAEVILHVDDHERGLRFAHRFASAQQRDRKHRRDRHLHRRQGPWSSMSTLS